MEKLEQIITTYQQIIQKTELELQNARKRIYYISLLRLILFVGAVANAIIFFGLTVGYASLHSLSYPLSYSFG